MYDTLDPPRKRANDVNLQAPRASYGSRRSRVARRGKRKFNRPRIVQKANQVGLVLGCARADFPSHIIIIDWFFNRTPMTSDII